MPKQSKPEELKSKPVATHLSVIFVVFGIVLTVVGAAVGLQQHHQNVVAIKQARSNSNAPSTTKPTQNAFASYTTAADLPRYIFIPKINVKAIVKSLGLTKNNQIASPANVYDTGWYNGSAKPSQPGATLIDGHVSSWNTNGVFYNLKLLRPGDSIQIELGNGSKLNYIVVKSQTYDSNNIDTAAMLQPVIPGKSGLNIITCTGDVIKGTNEFNKRIIVFAVQA